MSILTTNYRKNLWIHLGTDPDALEADLVGYAETLVPDGPDVCELRRIAALAAHSPTATPEPDRFLMVGGDGTWLVLEFSVLSEGPDGGLDPEQDLSGLNAEEVEIGAGHGYRLITMLPGGPVDGQPASELLLARLDYFLRTTGAGGAWIYAGTVVPNPELLPVVVPMIEELLAGVEVE